MPVVQCPPHNGTTVTSSGVAVSSSAADVAATETPSPIPTTAPARTRPAQDLRGEPTDHPPGQVLRAGDGRREMDRIELVTPAQDVRRRAFYRGAIDDPDLDDALGPGPLEQPRDLWPRDPELLRDRVLRLAQFVVQAARPDELRRSRSSRAPGAVEAVVHVCTFQMCIHDAGIIPVARAAVNHRPRSPI